MSQNAPPTHGTAEAAPFESVLSKAMIHQLSEFLQQNSTAILRDLMTNARLVPAINSQINSIDWDWDDLNAREQDYITALTNQLGSGIAEFRTTRMQQIRLYQTAGFTFSNYVEVQTVRHQAVFRAAVRSLWWRPNNLQLLLTNLVTLQTLDTNLAMDVFVRSVGNYLQTTAHNIAVNIDQLGRSSQAIKHNARELEDLLKAALTYTQSSYTSVGQTVQGVEMVQHTINDLATRTVDLGQQLSEVSSVLDLIKDVTAETDILAINASVEAAGAGEVGQRFGVVANEIRRLSDRVRENASQVERLIYEVQAAANAAVRAAEASVNTSQTGVTVAHQAGESVSNAVAHLEETHGAISELSTSAHQHTLAVNELAVAVREIARTLSQLEISPISD